MSNFTLQFNESFIQGFSLGFILALLLLIIGGYFYLRATFMTKKHLVAQLAESQSAEAATEQSRQLLLQAQQESQDVLEEKVQERTLELNIALQELEEANHELEQKNTTDALTGLYNRRFYDQKIIAEYRRSKRNLTPLSLVVLDIDHFKKVNDSYGHLAGDKSIAWVSEHIKQSLKRSADHAFRYGGEEFCLILPDTYTEGATLLAESIRKRIAEQVCVYDNIAIPLTISCGISTYQQQTDVQPEQLFSCADKALYKAKHAGRNQTQFISFIEA